MSQHFQTKTTMHKSVYDVLHKRYRLHRPLAKVQESLAQAIISSGKMRLDADTESNFMRLLLPKEQIDLTFTLREITTPTLRTASQQRLLAILSKRHAPAKAAILMTEYFEIVRKELEKRHPISAHTELMMARALVLCNALPVMTLIHRERAEIFISFGQSVGEVMDVARWEKSGENSGLQAVGGGENAVYVSCGGHPFLSQNEFRHSGDGPAALARFMIIAAQETGHNADMIRNEQGQWTGRYSAVGWSQAPSEKSAAARISDIARTEQIWSQCKQFGIGRIAEWERHLQFYRKVHVRSWRHMLAWLCSKIGWQIFKFRMKKYPKLPLPRLQRDAYPCMLLQAFFPDMLANLSPQADVYKRKNAKEEEAIACIEAVARVPQQVVKWGHEAVQATTPLLYDFYYHNIVPACESVVRKNYDRL